MYPKGGNGNCLYTREPRQKGEGKPVISMSKRAKKRLTDAFYGRKFSWFSCLFVREKETVLLRWLKGMQGSKLGI